MSAINVMNLKTNKVDDIILAELGISEYTHLFPPIKRSDEICGCVTPKAAEETGLIEGTPVAGGLFDVSSCSIATGVTDEHRMSVVAGTWSINSLLSRKAVYSERLFMTSIHCLKDYFITIEGSMTSAGNLEWMIKSFLQSDNEVGKSKNVYEYCNRVVSDLAPEECRIIFLPFLYGTNVNADAKAGFLGIDGSQDKRHMIRAMYEGVVFSHMMHIERLFSFLDKPEAVRISGGATESKIWVQMFADVFQIPIEVSAAKELGTLGASMCVSVAVGDYPDIQTAVKAMSHTEYTCEPDTSRKDIYQKKYAIYKSLIENLDGVWKMWRAL